MFRKLLARIDLNRAESPPDSPQHIFETRMLTITVVLITLGCAVMMIYIVLDPPSSVFPWIVINILSGMIGFQILIFALAKIGYQRFAIQADILFLCAILIYSGFESGGIYASSTLIFFVPLVLSATILTIRFTIIIAGIMILSFGGLYLVELLGHLPDAPFKDLPYRMTILTGLTIVLTAIFAAHRQVLNATEKMRIQLETATERLRTQQQLTQDLAHDLRTPITVVQTSLYLIKRKQERGQETTTSFAALENSVGKLQIMVEGFIELAKLDNDINQGAGMLQLIDLDSLVEDVFNEFYDLAEKYDVQLSKDVNHSVSVLGSYSQLERVIGNLVSNAIYYGQDGKQVKVTIGKMDGNAIVSVIDNGQGISLDEQAMIFDRFYRVNDARTATDHTGSGIGLSIVKRIIEGYGGRIEVESKLGSGSKFTIFLPLQ